MLTNYFSLLAQSVEADGSVLSTVKLNPQCSVYEGHFPGNPVSPGVKLTIKAIKQCRYSALITPLKQSVLKFKAVIDEAEGAFSVAGTVFDDDNTYIDIKFQLN